MPTYNCRFLETLVMDDEIEEWCCHNPNATLDELICKGLHIKEEIQMHEEFEAYFKNTYPNFCGGGTYEASTDSFEDLEKQYNYTIFKRGKQACKNVVDDHVNSPSHYQLLPGIEVIDVRKAIFKKIPEGTSPFVIDCYSRSLEYLMRMWGKNKLEDAEKARTYLNWLIEEMESNK